LLIATIVVGLITALAFLVWLNTPTIGPSLQQSKLDLLAAQVNLQSVNQAISGLESEMAQHRGIVSLRE
jgi:nitrate/nitrite transporter NarK